MKNLRIQIDDVVRDMTEEEIANYEAQQNAFVEAENAQKQARAIAEAKLALLGLTTEDLKALGLG